MCSNSSASSIDPSLSNTTTASEPVDPYDHQGAALYIAVILVWYSSGLAMMLFLQVRPRSLQQQFLFDSSDSPRKTHLPSNTKNPYSNYRNIQADSRTKQILNELKDPERRQRLWKIYYASTEKQDEPYPQYYQTITSDSATIDRIKRKLDVIRRTDSTYDENAANEGNLPLNKDTRASTLAPFDSTKFFTKRFTSLRRPNGNSTSAAAAAAVAATNTRPLLVRTQSQDDSSLPNVTLEMEPLVSDKQSSGSANNNINSRKRNNRLENRFTIEKVPEKSTTSTTVDENIKK